MNTSNYWDRQVYDGDVELGIRRVSLCFTYVNFLFRIPYFLVFWKVSVEYNRFFNQDIQEAGFGGSSNVTPPKREVKIEY